MLTSAQGRDTKRDAATTEGTPRDDKRRGRRGRGPGLRPTDVHARGRGRRPRRAVRDAPAPGPRDAPLGGDGATARRARVARAGDRGPREGALRNPPARQVLEGRARRQLAEIHLSSFLEPLPRPDPQDFLGRRLGGAVHHLDFHAERAFRPLLAPPTLARVHPQVREPWETAPRGL